MFAVHLFLFLNRFKHEGSTRFGSWRQTAMFVFIRSARRAQQPAPSPNLVPLLGIWLGKQSREKANKASPGIKSALEKCAGAYSLHHSGCSSWNPARCRRYRDHPRWQNLRLLLKKCIGVRRRLFQRRPTCFRRALS